VGKLDVDTAAPLSITRDFGRNQIPTGLVIDNMVSDYYYFEKITWCLITGLSYQTQSYVIG
jgi:hypothetical protein